MKTIKRGNIIDKRWKWIARDNGGGSFVFTEKLIKGLSKCWHGDYYIEVTDLMDNTLGNVRWEDDEPTKIEG